MLAAASAHIECAAGFAEDFAHFSHALFGVLRRDERIGTLVLLGREVASFEIASIPRMEAICRPSGSKFSHFLRDLHRAEFGAAHRAEMRRLGALGR